MKLRLTEEQVKKASTEAYAKMLPNAYFDNGFKAGMEFVLSLLTAEQGEAETKGVKK